MLNSTIENPGPTITSSSFLSSVSRTTTSCSSEGCSEMVHGAAMGSARSPIVVKLFMEDFETKTISTSTNHQRLWTSMWMISLSSRKEQTKTVPGAHQLHQCLYPLHYR